MQIWDAHVWARNWLIASNESAKHNLVIWTFQKYYFCCRQKFLQQLCLHPSILVLEICKIVDFSIKPSDINKIKIFWKIMLRKIFLIFILFVYLTMHVFSGLSKFGDKNVFFFPCHKGTWTEVATLGKSSYTFLQ